MRRGIKRFLSFVLILVTVLLLRHFVFLPVSVIGSSMEPTLTESDRLWLTSLKTPQRFDIISFPSPRTGQRIAKRVIGLPGETVEYRDETLYINGKSYAEPYLTAAKKAVGPTENYTQDFTLANLPATATETVPAGTYFVLGDNRPKADDSRYFGFVEQESVEGVLYFRYFPLERIGLP